MDEINELARLISIEAKDNGYINCTQIADLVIRLGYRKPKQFSGYMTETPVIKEACEHGMGSDHIADYMENETQKVSPENVHSPHKSYNQEKGLMPSQELNQLNVEEWLEKHPWHEYSNKEIAHCFCSTFKPKSPSLESIKNCIDMSVIDRTNGMTEKDKHIIATAIKSLIEGGQDERD